MMGMLVVSEPSGEAPVLFVFAAYATGVFVLGSLYGLLTNVPSRRKSNSAPRGEGGTKKVSPVEYHAEEERLPLDDASEAVDDAEPE